MKDQRKDQINSIIDIAAGTVAELRAAAAGAGGLGGIATLADRLEREAATLKAYAEEDQSKPTAD